MGSGDYKEKESADDGRYFSQCLFLGTQFSFVAANLQPQQKKNKQKAFSHWPTEVRGSQLKMWTPAVRLHAADCLHQCVVVAQCRKKSHLKTCFPTVIWTSLWYSFTWLCQCQNVFQHCTELRKSRILLPTDMSHKRGKVSILSRYQKRHFWEPGWLRGIHFVRLISPCHVPKETFPTSADFQRQHSGCAYGQVLQS